jgi:hypothetical protein
VWALSAGLVPGLHRPGLATAALIGAGAIVVRAGGAPRRPPLPGRRARLRRRPPRPRRARQPGCYARRVASWSVLSRALRLGSLACFLAAFALPVSVTAALVVMVAHSSGRLLPFSPASAGH